MKNYLIIILLLLSLTSFGQYERHGRITAKSVQLDSTWTPYNIRIGESYYDKDDQTISTVLPNGVVGQQFHELFKDVLNQTGATLENGKVARRSGAVGNSGKITADYMIANGNYQSLSTIGIITEDIPNGEQGKVTWFGKVRGINTTGTPYGETWNDGDTLYVHKDSLGGMTNVMPSAPDQKINIGVVVKAHTSGTIDVNPWFSCKLQDIENINGTPLDSSGQFLVWDNTSQYFDFDYNINDYATIDTLLHYYLIAVDSLGEQRDDINRIDNDYVEKAASSTDNAIARFDGAAGKVIQNSNVIISDLGKVTAGADATSGYDLLTYNQLHNATLTPDFAGVEINGVAIGSANPTLYNVLTNGNTSSLGFEAGGSISEPVILNNNNFFYGAFGTTGVYRNTVNTGNIVLAGGNSTSDGGNITIGGSANGSGYKIQFRYNSDIAYQLYSTYHDFRDYDIYTSGTIQATTGKFTNLTDNYIPVSTASGLDDSPIYTDGTNVGIGTSSPSFGLEISNITGNAIAQLTAKNTSWSAIYFGDTDLGGRGRLIYDHSSDAMLFYEDSAERMRIDGGNVGIGTTSPSYKLDVNGTGRFSSSVTATSFINSVVNDPEETLQSDGSTKNFFDYSESLKLDSLKVGDATNNTEIKDDGTLVLNGTATAFNDLTFPVSTLKSVGVANKPDYDATDLGLLFPDADTTEMIGVSVQMPHAWKEGSSISPHIHVIQTSADTAIFGISYRIYNLGETVPSWTTVFTYDHAYEWSSGSMLQILEFPMIDMTGKTISSQIDIKIWRRTVDNIAGDVLLKQFDIHYEIDGFGSSTEYTK